MTAAAGDHIVRRTNSLGIISLICLLVFTTAGSSETSDFGGHPDRFKGGGDRTPPRCQIDLPRASTEPFFIKWNCTDDVSPEDEIRSELWIMRKDAVAAEKLSSFIGFPASVYIDSGILRQDVFADGLPASFRLVAYDRAGIAVITPFLPVLGQDNSVDTCDLLIVTEPTEADGGTIGQPSQTLSVSDAQVLSRQTTNSDLSVQTTQKVAASPCEITDLCEDKQQVTFESSLTVTSEDSSDQDDSDSGTLTPGTKNLMGSLSLSPGNLLVSLSGEGQVSAGALESFEVSGNTVIDGASATVTLSCEQ